jgi:hypothetical protein
VKGIALNVAIVIVSGVRAANLSYPVRGRGVGGLKSSAATCRDVAERIVTERLREDWIGGATGTGDAYEGVMSVGARLGVCAVKRIGDCRVPQVRCSEPGSWGAVRATTAGAPPISVNLRMHEAAPVAWRVAHLWAWQRLCSNTVAIATYSNTVNIHIY